MYYPSQILNRGCRLLEKKILVSPTIQSSFRSTKRFSSRCLFSIYHVCTMKFTIICWLEKPLSSCCHSVALHNLQTPQSLPHHFCYTLICFFLYLLNTYSLDSGAANKGKRGSVENSWNSKFLVLNVVGWYVYIHNMT